MMINDNYLNFNEFSCTFTRTETNMYQTLKFVELFNLPSSIINEPSAATIIDRSWNSGYEGKSKKGFFDHFFNRVLSQIITIN